MWSLHGQSSRLIDFDVGDIAIINHLLNRLDATPWRMTELDYTEALAGPTTDLVTTIGSTPWGPGLTLARQHHGRAVHKEAIASILLSGLNLN